MVTHEFESTGAAYDATQCDENIKTGDVLIIPSEGVIGIADTWPVAVTVEHGNLHSPAEGMTLARCLLGRVDPLGDILYIAKAIAAERGWPVRD
jgi:hypothetical protein